MKKIFITFGAGNSDITMASLRLSRATECTGFFDKVIGYSEATFKSSHSDFYSLHQKFITANARGWGYWVWKPLIILENLRMLDEGDILVYADAGCEFGRLEALIKILKYTREHGICFTKASHDHPTHTKKLVLEKFGNMHPIFSSKMIQATCLCIRKSSETELLIQAWLEFLTSSDYMNVNDVIAENEASCFIEHRHDQSALSLLIYQRGWGHHEQNALWNLAFPQFRNRTGKSFHFVNAYSNLQKPRMLNAHDVLSVRCTSPATGLAANDISRLIGTPDRGNPRGIKLSQTTSKPKLSIQFKKPEFIERILIHNSQGHEADLLPLRIYLIQDKGTEMELARIYYAFGGWYNLSPLIIELPLSHPANGIGIQSLAEHPTALRISALQVIAM